MNKYKTDFHNHSNLSRCAWKEMTVESMVRRFEEFGLEQAGISDHLYPDGKIPERFQFVKGEIEKQRSFVEVFVGAEVDMLYPGKLIADREILDRFDYILIACSHYQLKDLVIPPLYFDYRTIAQSMFDFMMSATSCEFADIIAHPFDVRSLKNYREDFELEKAMESFSDADFDRIIKNLKENGMALELNTSLIEDEYARALFRFLKRAKEAGVRFSLGSDAHWLSCMYGIPAMKGYLDTLGITEDDIWTISSKG